MSNDSDGFYEEQKERFYFVAVRDRKSKSCEVFPILKNVDKKSPCQGEMAGASMFEVYFFAEQAHPHPDDFLSSCFSMEPASAHAGHFLGLHLPSFVAPHFSHLNTAIFSLL